MRLRDVWITLRKTASEWIDDDAPRLAAALAYYSLLSIAPLLVIVVAAAGLLFGTDAARGRIASELGDIVGGSAADGIQTLVASARSPSSGLLGTLIGVVTLFVGASGVFSELQSSLNTIWEVKAKSLGFWGEVRARFFSFTMVLGVAFLLLVSLVVSSVLSAVGKGFAELLPGGEMLWQLVNLGFSLAVVTALFAAIFKIIPDAQVAWRDVWLGAAVTSALFTLGKLALGLYLGKAAVGSAYGAAGSVIALVVWVYYAAQIFLFGAELTQVHARLRGRAIRPSAGATELPC